MSLYQVNIFASFNAESLVDPQQQLSDYGNVSFYLNTVPGNQTCSILQHPLSSISSLVITSNGINDGNFNIYPVKFVGESVQFVLQLEDVNGFSVKDFPLLSDNNISVSLMYPNGDYVPNVVFESNFGTLSSLTQGGFYKGFFVSPITANNVVIKAVCTSLGLNLTGYSTSFDIYPTAGLYQLRKINENFDQTAAYKSLAFQPVLADKNVLFDSFLGQIVGNANSDPNTLGIETYEKISNFVSNIDDIDYCNIDQLKSLLDSINATYENFNYPFPPSFKRLADILSVKHKKLFGQINQYNSNFDNKGFVNTFKYGKNKGAALDVDTTILSASDIDTGVIIAQEKFSKQYTTVNTNLKSYVNYITVTPSISTYALSSFNDDWGWNLVLPGGLSGSEVGKYYDFYEYVPGIEGSLLQKFIDFDNQNNTLSITNSGYNDYIKTGGIIDNILINNLYTNLEILS